MAISFSLFSEYTIYPEICRNHYKIVKKSFFVNYDALLS